MLQFTVLAFVVAIRLVDCCQTNNPAYEYRYEFQDRRPPATPPPRDPGEELLTRYNEFCHNNVRFGEFTEDGYEECTNSHRLKRATQEFSENVEDLVSLLETNFRQINLNDYNNPVYSYTVFRIDSWDLTLAVRARIYNRHIRRPGTRPNPTTAITEQVDRMKRVISSERDSNDELGHLLASVLGGPNEPYNFFPQSRSHNRGAGSRWNQLERALAAFLRIDSDRYVEWTVALTYDMRSSTPHRPTAVALTVRAFRSDRLVWRGENMFFTNHPYEICTLDRIEPFHKRQRFDHDEFRALRV